MTKKLIPGVSAPNLLTVTQVAARLGVSRACQGQCAS